MHIREATIEDCAGIARVQVDSYRTAYAGIFPQAYLDQFSYAEQERDWREWISSKPEDLLYVAELETGEIVGYALARPGPRAVPLYDSELVALHVRALHQRQGVGRHLVAAVAERLARQGYRSMMLWVLEKNRARGFYERLGGQLLDEKQMGGGQPEVAYGWPVIGTLYESGGGAGAVGTVAAYREVLRTLEDWDAYLMQESRLPGPRANLELAYAVALEGSEGQLRQYAGLDCEAAPPNTPTEFLAVCGVLGLGYLMARGEGLHLTMLRASASDARWRIREAVALGLQEYGRTAMESLLEAMEGWSKGTPLERRAVVATLCEPGLLADRDHASRVLDTLDVITSSILDEPDRRSEEFRVLRKGLAYGWSVVVAVQPTMGKPRMERWIRSQDVDVRWLMRQNLGKKRLARMDEAWVKAQLEILGS